jgi:hypothetical protein
LTEHIALRPEKLKIVPSAVKVESTTQAPPPAVCTIVVTTPEFLKRDGTRLPQEKLKGEVKQ